MLTSTLHCEKNIDRLPPVLAIWKWITDQYFPCQNALYGIFIYNIVGKDNKDPAILSGRPQ